MKKADSRYTAACNAYLCRGYQFSDNASNVRSVKTGDEIAFHVDIVAGHRPARANVSIVDTKMNKVLAEVKSWKGYPCDSTSPCDDDGTFLPVMP